MRRVEATTAIAKRERTLNLQGVSIMVGADAKFTRKVITDILAGFGASKMIESGDGIEAMDIVRQGGVDLLICDTMLTRVDGIELTQRLRASPGNPGRTLPVLLLSAYPRPADVRRMRDCGANMILATPVVPQTLFDRLAWIAHDSRPFVSTAHFTGPDRRHTNQPPPPGQHRRKTDGGAGEAEPPADPAG